MTSAAPSCSRSSAPCSPPATRRRSRRRIAAAPDASTITRQHADRADQVVLRAPRPPRSSTRSTPTPDHRGSQVGVPRRATTGPTRPASWRSCSARPWSASCSPARTRSTGCWPRTTRRTRPQACRPRNRADSVADPPTLRVLVGRRASSTSPSSPPTSLSAPPLPLTLSAPVPADAEVVALAAGDDVGTVAGVQAVVAAVLLVAAFLALELVVTRLAVQDVSTVLAVQDVVAGLAVEPVVARLRRTPVVAPSRSVVDRSRPATSSPARGRSPPSVTRR